MLQTIYETESCFSSASTDGGHQPLELLSGNRSSGKAMPTDGESSLAEGAAGRAAGCSALEGLGVFFVCLLVVCQTEGVDLKSFFFFILLF